MTRIIIPTEDPVEPDAVDGLIDAIVQTRHSPLSTAVYRFRGPLVILCAQAVVAQGRQDDLRQRLEDREHELEPWDERKDAHALLHLPIALGGIVGLPLEWVASRTRALAAVRDPSFPDDIKAKLNEKLAVIDRGREGAPPITTSGILGRVLAEAMAATHADRLAQRLCDFTDGIEVPWTHILAVLRGLNEFESLKLAAVFNHLRPHLHHTGITLGNCRDSGVMLGDMDLGEGDFSASGTCIVIGNLLCASLLNSGPEDVLLVTGNLGCTAVRTSGQICVAGRASVRDYIYGEYNDQSLIVGNGVKTHLLIDNDHGINKVGGTWSIRHSVDVHDRRFALPIEKLRTIFPHEFIVSWASAHGEDEAEEMELPEADRAWCLDYEKFMEVHAAGGRVFLDRRQTNRRRR